MFNALVETPEQSPFATLEQEGLSAQPVVSDDVARGTAQLKALADIGPNQQALVDGWKDLSNSIENTIKINGDYGVRMEAAVKSREDQLGALNSLRLSPDVSNELLQGTALVARQVLSEDLDRKAKYALEQDAATKMQELAVADPVQAELIRNNIQDGDATDVMRDRITKQLVLSREIAKASASDEERSIFESAADFVLGALPLRSNAIREGNVDLDKTLKNWYDKLFAGQRERREANTLWDMPTEEFAQYVPELLQNIKNNATFFGYQNKAGELHLLSEYGGRTPEAWQTNAFGALDVVSFIPFGKATSAAGYMARAGGRREAVNMITASMAEGVAVKEATNEALPGVMALAPQATNVGMAMSAADRLTHAEELAQKILPQLKTQRFASAEEFNKAVSTAEDELRSSAGPYQMISVDKQAVKLPDGTEIFRVLGRFGRKDGSGFASAGTARSAGKRASLIGEPVQDASGQWFFEVNRDVKEAGFYFSNVKNEGATNIFSRLLLGSKQKLDAFTYGLGVQSGGGQQRILKHYGDYLKDTLGKLTSKEYSNMSAMLQASQELGTWFDRAAFDANYQRTWNKVPAHKEWEAYQAAVDLNDVEYAIRNSAEYKKRVTAGLENINLKGPGFKITDENARVLRDWGSQLKAGDRAYVVDNGTLYNNVNKLDDVALQKLKADGYVLIQTERALDTGRGSVVRQFLAKGTSFEASPLKRMQLGYREGGHRFYTGKAFAKQARVRTLEDGSESLMNPNTYVTGTRAEMLAWSETVNEALDMIKTGKISPLSPSAAQDLENALGDSKAVVDYDALIHDVNTGRVDIDTPFEAVGDRQLPSQYTDKGVYMFDRDLSLGESYGQMYYSGKGEHLKDYSGQFAKTYDPYKAINRSLQSVSTLSSFTDFRLSTVQRWAENFGQYLDTAHLHDGASAEFIFSNAQVRKNVDARLRNIAEGQRDSIKRILSWKTPFDQELESAKNRLVDFVAGDTPGLRDKIVNETVNWLDQTNPVAFMRGWAFDMKLGMFNPGQLVVQASTLLAATAMNPKFAFHALGSVLPTRAVMLAKDLPVMLDHLVNGGVHKLMGFNDVNEFKQYMTSVRDSGIMDIGNGHTLIAQYGAQVNTGGFSKVTQFREAGRFFFNEAEMANLAGAYRIAWGEVSEKLPNLSKDSREFQRMVYSRATDYGFGMQREAQAAWQRGLMSIPTQFFAYNARMMEALLSKTFTRQQRANLLISQAFLYGTAGVPLLGIASNYLKDKTGHAPEPGTAAFMLDRGFLDSLYYQVTGQNVAIGGRLAQGNFLADTVKKVFGASEYGPVSASDLMGGASWTIWGDVFGDMGDWIKYSSVESGAEGKEALSRDAALRLASNISTVSNGLKAWSVLKYGTYISKPGTTMVDDLPSTEAYAIALGFQPGESEEISAMMNYTKHHEEIVSDAAKVMRNYRTRYLNEPDHRSEIRQEIQLFTNTLPESVRRQALRRANRESESLFDTAAERMERLRQQGDKNQEVLNNGSDTSTQP